ncbi:MAG: hypothetical protein COB66_04710 [Coxiella sp. (in: Bacteria)]|nr:MAG: hypothetical protein COB66_04710 [Coxiella sp. (in: g-proteobacteria)]
MIIINQKQFMWLSIVLLMFVSLLLLVGPRVPTAMQKKDCVVNVHIVGPFGISMACDSPEYILDAVHPSHLLKKDSVRQSRPGLSLAAYVVSKPLSFLNTLSRAYHPKLTRSDIKSSRANALLQSGLSVFAAYALLNLATLIAACYLFFSMVRVHKGITLATMSLLVMLLINPATEAYFWSPHDQMFNIMGPLLLVWIGYQGFHSSVFERKWYWISAMLGLLVTAYGLFLLFAPVLFLIFVYQFTVKFNNTAGIGRYIVRLAVHAVVFIVPTLIWYLYVMHTTGSYYVHEAAAFHQFTWIISGLHQGVGYVLHRLVQNAIWTMTMMVRYSYWLLLIIVGLIVTLRQLKFASWDKGRLVVFGVMTALFILFSTFNGYIAPHVEFTVVPIFIITCAYLIECLSTQLSAGAQKIVLAGCVGSMAVYATITYVYLYYLP